MEELKTGWNFFQNEILGMQWLNRIIGNLIHSCGLGTKDKIGGSVQFSFMIPLKSWYFWAF